MASRRLYVSISLVVCIAQAGVLLFGCTAALRPSVYETIPTAISDAHERARQANTRGLKLAAAGRYDEAEKAFREALAADIGYAGAHNNLAIVLGAQADWYQAALEASFAIRLAPRAIEPRLTLGEIYERASGSGWQHEAVASYQQALAIDPQNVEVIGRLARVCLKEAFPRPELDDWLRVLAQTPGHPRWQAWALRVLQERSP